MFNNRKLWLLIIFSINNQELFGIEKPPKKKSNNPLSNRILLEILQKAERETNEMIAAQKAQQEQEEQKVQEELAKLQAWVDAPLEPSSEKPSFGSFSLKDLSGEDLLRLQNAFAGAPDNSTNFSGSLSQMSAQDVLRLQQEREAQATEAAAKQAEQQRIEAERTEQSKREAAQKEAELQLQVEREQRERAARIKLYQQQQAAEEEKKRRQAAEQRRSFYDSKHRQSIIEGLRKEVIQNKVMGPQDALQEIQRVFGDLVDFANGRNDQELLNTINSDRQVLVNELFDKQSEKEQNGQAAAASARTVSNVVTLADLKNKFAQMAGGQPSFEKGDDLIVVPDLTKANLLTMSLEELSRLISQQDIKKPEALEYFVIGKVGELKQHAEYPHIFQRIVPVQYGANCGYHAMANAFNIANHHLLGNPLETVSDQGLYIQKHQMIDDAVIERNWQALYQESTNGIAIPLAIVTDKLEPMGQLGIKLTAFSGHMNHKQFLINTIQEEIRKDGRRAFVIVANTSSKGVHWYGLVILKNENGSLQFVFVDSAGMTTENVGNGNVANATHLHQDHRSSQNIYQLIEELMKR